MGNGTHYHSIDNAIAEDFIWRLIAAEAYFDLKPSPPAVWHCLLGVSVRRPDPFAYTFLS